MVAPLTPPVKSVLDSMIEEQRNLRELLGRVVKQLAIGDRSVPIRERVLLSPSQAADYLGISDTTLAALRNAGDVEYVHVGTVRRYTRSSLDAFVARQREREQAAAVRPLRRKAGAR